MLSNQLIKYYEDSTKGGAAPHTMHNIPLEFAKMLLDGLGNQHPEGKVSIKQANNIWNFVLEELKSKGYDPYTVKENGFKDLLSELTREEIAKVKANE